MGLTKQYLRYVASAVFGLIGSQKANIVFVTLRGEKGRYVAVPACEHVFIWDLRKGEKILILQGLKQEVTCLCPSPDGLHLAVGYEDGSVRIFSLLSGEGNVTFNGHKAAITSLKYDQLGGRLASGSKDTDIIVWDVINESGLYRLKGHKDAITQALFLREKNLLVSSGKDTVVKWWDLDTQHCFKTMVGHRTEVWGLVLVSEEKRLITGASDSELRAWDIAYLQEIEDLEEPEAKKIKGSSPGTQDTHRAEVDPLEMDEAPEDRILTCKKAGSIMREGRDRVVSLAVDRTGRILACHGTDSVLEVFCILSKEEIQKKMDKKMKKARKKAKLNSCQGEEEGLEVTVEMTLQDEIQRVTNIKTSAKIKSFDLIHSPHGEVKAVFLLQNNMVELYSLSPSTPTPQPVRTSRITLGGHRSDVRTLSFSSDNIAVLSAAADSVKIWNRSTLQCIRTMTCDYALCSFFVPGDRQVVIGTKVNRLFLGFGDLSYLVFLRLFEKSGFFLSTLETYMSFDFQRGFVTGGADKSVKFWDFELVKDENSTQKRLSVKQTRTLQLDEDVLCVNYSPNQKLLAVSLLDCTVKIFYVDTLKVSCLCLIGPLMLVNDIVQGSLCFWQVPGEVQGENYFTGKKTIETVKAAERIMEAIELYREETAKMKEHKAICKAAGKEVPLPTNPILLAYGSISPSAYVLEIFKGIKSSELEESLLVLPFSYVPDILKLSNEFMQLGSDVELLCRCLFFLFRIHFGQITSNQMLVPVIEKLKETTISKVSQVRDVIGFNMAGLDYLKRECEAKSEVMFFAEATSQLEEKKRKRKKREKLILTLT
ncbi:WD repeat-containing protein 3 [Pteropus vampyrus]|uniref:WD repeat-containing protein 3 n=1 Tax=Pteropus vampyrus TaxID=132908 RepID=A0A6P6CUU6_PTEVA|nr:WD repeat-containing protein 3 [Pteropus vampyrus]